MKNVLFFTETKWAFGSIHYALTKYLFQYGINADVINWCESFPLIDFEMFINKYDYFVTTPSALNALKSYGVPDHKIVLIAHGEIDIKVAKDQLGSDVCNGVYKYAVVSEKLKEKSIEFGVNRIPDVISVGINFDFFYSKVPKELKTIGFTGAHTTDYLPIDIKRFKLVNEVSHNTNIPIAMHQRYHFLGMPTYYHSVDCVMMASTEESVCLPMLEGAASGRLCIGTSVGIFDNGKNRQGAIIIESFDEQTYIDNTTRILNFYKENQSNFILKCHEIQNYAYENYDWKYHIESWINLFN